MVTSDLVYESLIDTPLGVMLTSLVLTVELLDEEFVEGVLKGTNRDELTDHEQDWTDTLREDLPEQVDHLEVSLACNHYSVQVGQ